MAGSRLRALAEALVGKMEEEQEVGLAAVRPGEREEVRVAPELAAEEQAAQPARAEEEEAVAEEEAAAAVPHRPQAPASPRAVGTEGR